MLRGHHLRELSARYKGLGRRTAGRQPKLGRRPTTEHL